MMEKCKPQPNKWVEYNIYPELENVSAMARARINAQGEIEVKLLFCAKRGLFYSYVEDAKIEASRLFEKSINTQI